MIWILLGVAFFFGSIPTGYIVGLCHGVDLRKQGSGNIGATNARRVLGKKAGLYTFIGDVAKGIIALFAPQLIGGLIGFEAPYEALLPLFGFLAILGHCFSPFLAFNGGKGVATSAGVFACIAPVPTCAAFAVFGAALKLSHYVSLSSILATITLVITVSLDFYGTYGQLSRLAVWLTSVLIIARHKDNIGRLLSGTESKVTS